MFRRALSILLCGCLLAGSLPVTGFAAEEQIVETTETEETIEDAGGGISTTRSHRRRKMQTHSIQRRMWILRI